MIARAAAAAVLLALAALPRSGRAQDGAAGAPAVPASPPAAPSADPANGALPAGDAAAHGARGDDWEDATAASPDPPPDPQLEAARIAWRYFERNYHPATGLVNSVEGYPNTSMWDLGSTIFATVAARELGLLDARAFATRVDALLWTLEMQTLFEGELPNKAYDAATGRMADYANAPTAKGIGFSAIDIARAVSALTALAERHPEHRAAVGRVLSRWRWCRLLGDGELHGALVEGGAVRVVQEGRLGYEQYAADVLSRLGFRLAKARSYDRFTAETPILGVPVRYDTRDRRRFGAVDALVTDPWVLGALELGHDAARDRLLRSILDVQRVRFERTGIVTAMGEDHIDQPPWFVYGAIWADGQAWQTVTPAGEDASRFQALSTKTAFALATLFPNDPYARVLHQAIAGTVDAERGWFAGVYERGGLNRSLNANTNGIILEAVLFARTGPLHARLHAPRSLTAGGAAYSGACAPGTPEAARAEEASLAVPGAAPSPSPGRLYANPLVLSLFTDYRGVDRAGVGGVLTIWPWRATFLRIGAEATPWSPIGPARMLWGVGWDDWRDNTFFLHVDNWGPFRPEDAPAVHQAEVNAGFRGPSLCGGKLCLSPLLGATVPFAGGPYVSARATLTLSKKWFVMGGAGWTALDLPGKLAAPSGTPRWRFFYGLGRWDWHPGTLFLTYYDWGPTTWSHNGVLALGVNLAY